MEDIIIGKHTLESLTSGMYADPFVLYREYIQNSTDALDMAAEEGLITDKEGVIEIILEPSENRIVIYDNGTGIKKIKAEQTLLSIGNSNKREDKSRGFRGIGRLSALGYCSVLKFETTFLGENIGSRIIIDAKRLSSLLFDDHSNTSMIDVLSQVCSMDIYQEEEKKHYFRVIMDGVEPSSNLLNKSLVVDYISQNAPVPYNHSTFSWGNEIERRIENAGYRIKNYNISLYYGEEHIHITKPYRDEFLVDKSKNTYDKIKDISVFRYVLNKDIKALGWIAKTEYLGSIYDRSIKGIRLRKGNIQIGNFQTLNTVFKDSRFNGWSIGEIFVLDPTVIPNARRDDFERNQAYYSLIEQLMDQAVSITKTIRSASLHRNRELSKAIKATEKAKTEINEALNEAIITGHEKGQLTKKLSRAKEAVNSITVNDSGQEYYRKIAFDELDVLTDRLKGATRFKAINLLDSLSNTEKRILEKVIDTLFIEMGDKAEEISEVILKGFKR